MKHHICASFRVSKEFYRGVNKEQASIGQGYVVLVNMYREISYLVTKVVENKKKGIIIKSLITNEIE